METRIKERLTGALILVAALVILVPEIFSGRRLSEPGREPPPAAPASEGPPLRSYTTEVDAARLPSIATPAETPPVAATSPSDAPSAPATAPSPAATPSTSAPAAEVPAPMPPEKPASVARAEPPATKPVARPVDKPADKPADKPTVSGGEWFVQVGSFSQAENAERYAQQLRKQGFSSVVLPPAGAKSLVRVRVGPVRSRDAAAALLERLAASGHKGAVVGS